MPAPVVEKRRRNSLQRFEIDGAHEARRFLTAHDLTAEEADRAWTAIALHTTPEIALLTRGVELDVPGIGYRTLTDRQRDTVLQAHPRPDFKNQILAAFTDGFKDRPHTTFGNVKADVPAHYLPGFVPGDFVKVIHDSDRPE